MNPVIPDVSLVWGFDYIFYDRSQLFEGVLSTVELYYRVSLYLIGDLLVYRCIFSI